ncbi:MAG TPA: carbohydrate binding domain-containing protein, partial [Cyclobacteriaceae bacterium]|nr:carbohydrate binding domain-containing protein [Cyclobacteriaceae bacterium]
MNVLHNIRKISPLLLMAIAIQLLNACTDKNNTTAVAPRVAVLLVDTDRTTKTIDPGIYGQFFEHINHSDVDGLFAEQIQGCGFEGEDFQTYWKPLEEGGKVSLENTPFKNGAKSVRLKPDGGKAGIEQGRIYLQKETEYNGSIWIKVEEGSPEILLQVNDSKDGSIATIPLKASGSEWQEATFSFTSPVTETQASVQIMAEGNGVALVDFLSLMPAEVRRNGMLRPDLLQALRDLKPSFLRWPGGSFASTYKWKDGIGPHVSRIYHPNEMWGGYSDYYGFGTHEFLEMCRQLDAKPMIVLPAMGTSTEQVQYAMDWVHYLIDPPSTELGKLRATNGHPDPYTIPYFQIDNEPMNHKLTPEQYAEIVNVYGRELRKIAPQSRIVACGQKRSADMVWSQKVIDLAGENFDILGCHNYEYENENFETGVQRIAGYLVKLRDYVQSSSHPSIKIAVLEWSLCRTYDWRAGLHAAGSLILYEQLSPELEMTCPALLMRNTTDNPEWRAFIYHDHVSWFPGS